MHVPAWPGLSPARFLRASRASLPFPLAERGKAFFYVARNGIYHLFRELQQDGNRATVLVPDYHSGNEVWAIRAAGARVRFYRIDRRMQPDLDQIAELAAREEGPLVVYVIHFIGWPQPIAEIADFCRERGILLVEDCALSLLSEAGGRPLGSFGDYSVYCLYKTLPIPNGGLLVGNPEVVERVDAVERRPAGVPSVAGRTLELGLEWVRSTAEPVGQVLFGIKRGIGRALSRAEVERTPVGDIGFDLSNVDMGMSPFCHRLLERFDYEAIRSRRRENFRLMAELLTDRATPMWPGLDEGVCPLFFPILVADKQRAAETLWEAGIEAVQFWNYGDDEAQRDRTSDAQFLREHVLELPIHQDIDARQIEYTADVVRRIGPPYVPDTRDTPRPRPSAASPPRLSPTEANQAFDISRS